MRLFIGNISQTAMQVLGIESFPFSESELKSKFRKLIHKYHEDKGGDKRKAQEIISAYNHLKNLVSLKPEENNINKNYPAWKRYDRRVSEPEVFNPVILKDAVMK